MPRVRSYLPPAKRLASFTASLGLASLALLGTPTLGLALETMTSDNYSVQMGNFNMTSGTKSSDSFTVTDTVGELAPGQFDSAGFTVLSGFQYIYALPEFSFRITDLSMELGVLQPGSFGTDSHDLVITTRSAGYTILARAQHVLRTNQGSEIPFTDCDSPCTITSAEPWANPANTGFGFNVVGAHAAADFATPNYFRPFADAEQTEDAQTIASHGSIVTDDFVTVTYQASAGQSQGAGMYTTVVDYTAVPNY